MSLVLCVLLRNSQNIPSVMLRETVTISNKLGLHVRASAKLVSLVSQFESQVELKKKDQKVNAKSIMGVMMLAAAKGSTITIEANGEDEAAAIDALKVLINDYFGEGE